MRMDGSDDGQVPLHECPECSRPCVYPRCALATKVGVEQQPSWWIPNVALMTATTCLRDRAIRRMA